VATIHIEKVLEPIAAREETVDPSRSIIDAHHHLWPRKRSFGYLKNEYVEDTSTHNVIASVFVECVADYDREAPEHLQPVGETRYVMRECTPPSFNSNDPFVGAGIVGRVDLLLEPRKVRESLEAHIAAAPGRFRGIRYSTIHWPDPDVLPGNRRNAPGVMRTEAFLSAFAELAALNLTFDAWLAFPQLDEIADLADQFPDTTIVLDHFGGPLNPTGTAVGRQECFAAWRPAMERLALRPNVYVKLGGAGMPVFGFGYEALDRSPSSDSIAGDCRPYVEVCLDNFGTARCMFESNFSPDKAGVTFHNLWNAFKKITANCSEAEKRDLFSGSAERVYGLDGLRG
jgi:L-fuconolactonase